MKDISKREKAFICISIALCICSVAVMINQIKITKQFKDNASETTKPQISWYEDANKNTEINTNINTNAVDGVSSENLSGSSTGTTYVINKNSKKIHSSDCSYAVNMSDENKLIVAINDLSEYTDNGYSVCSKCGAGY